MKLADWSCLQLPVGWWTHPLSAIISVWIIQTLSSDTDYSSITALHLPTPEGNFVFNRIVRSKTLQLGEMTKLFSGVIELLIKANNLSNCTRRVLITSFYLVCKSRCCSSSISCGRCLHVPVGNVQKIRIMSSDIIGVKGCLYKNKYLLECVYNSHMSCT